MEYRPVYQEFENFIVNDRHPHAPNYMLLRLMSLIFKWLGILCFVLMPLVVVWVGSQAVFNKKIVPYHEVRRLENGSVQGVTRTRTMPTNWRDTSVLLGSIALGFIIQGVVYLFISQLIHAYRDIARNGFKQNALLEKLTGEPIENQSESMSLLPDLAPVPKQEKDHNPLNPPAHWVPGTPRGWTISGLDINGNQFHLSYLWTSESEAVGYAKAEGLITIQEIQPIKG